MDSRNTSAPRHRSAPHFSASGLFSGLMSFAELEKCIADLPTVQERGNAFVYPATASRRGTDPTRIHAPTLKCDNAL